MAGLAGGVRVIYLYLTAAVDEEGPSIKHIRFSSFFLFFLQLNPSGSSENGRGSYGLVFSHLDTKTPKSSLGENLRGGRNKS